MGNIEGSDVTGGVLFPTLFLGKSGGCDVSTGRGAPQNRAGGSG